MSGSLTFPFEQQSVGGSFFHFCALQCEHISVILPMVTYSLLAYFTCSSGLLSTWMGDCLGTAGVVGFIFSLHCQKGVHGVKINFSQVITIEM